MSFVHTILKSTAASIDRLADAVEDGVFVSNQNAVLLTAGAASLVSFAFVVPALVRLYSNEKDPVLEPIPFPSSTFKSEVDVQADAFPQDDVHPQLLAQLSDGTIACQSPHTGDLLGHAPIDTPLSVVKKAHLARTAQKSWALTSFDQRRRVLRVLKSYIVENLIDMYGLVRLDTGKIMVDAAFGDVAQTLAKIKWLTQNGENALAPSPRGPQKQKIGEVLYQPLGLIGAIVPWNFPFYMFFNNVLEAIFSGNAIIIKPSEYTVYSTLHCARIVRRALAICGHDPELVQLAIGGGEVGSALISGAQVDKMYFTGSTKIGRLVSIAAAEHLIPIELELGGKDPLIICESTDLHYAVPSILKGCLINSGQLCIATERIFVHKKVHEKVIEMVLEAVKKVRLGVDIGAMVMGDVAIEGILKLLEDAKENGAEVLCGGKRDTVAGKGTYFQPTVVVGCTSDMEIANKEVFGPVISIFTWDNEEDLIETVNSGKFGLGSNIFSEDMEEANRISLGLRSGMASVNGFASGVTMLDLPFGGTGNSGSGRVSGIEGLRGYCLAKSYVRDRNPSKKSQLPKNFSYPLATNAASFLVEVIKLSHLPGIMAKFNSFRNIIKSGKEVDWIPEKTKANLKKFE